MYFKLCIFLESPLLLKLKNLAKTFFVGGGGGVGEE